MTRQRRTGSARATKCVSLLPTNSPRWNRFYWPMQIARCSSARFSLATDSSMKGSHLQGTYAMAVRDEQIVGVAMHASAGWVVLQAPEAAVAVARYAVGATQRPIVAVVGPCSQGQRQYEWALACQIASFRSTRARTCSTSTCPTSSPASTDLGARTVSQG